jgi:hypothetical protein
MSDPALNHPALIAQIHLAAAPMALVLGHGLFETVPTWLAG